MRYLLLTFIVLLTACGTCPDPKDLSGIPRERKLAIPGMYLEYWNRNLVDCYKITTRFRNERSKDLDDYDIKFVETDSQIHIVYYHKDLPDLIRYFHTVLDDWSARCCYDKETFEHTICQWPETDN